MTVVSPCTQNMMDSIHPHTVLSKLNEQRAQGLFCDVTIVVEDVKFRAHRNILAACSGYFRNALTAPLAWSSGQVLELMDLKSEVFASILDFIYCSNVTSAGPEDTGGLVAAGKRLGIPFLERLTEQERPRTGLTQTLPVVVKTTDSSKAPVPKTTKKVAQRPEAKDNARGPRITNAFSITEDCPGNNPFTPLVLTNGDRQSPDVGLLPASGPNIPCFPGNNETTQALSEHSYAVSQYTALKYSSQGDNNNNNVCKPSISQPNELVYQNAGPLKKRHRLRGTLCRSVLPRPDVPYTDEPTSVITAPAAFMTPPPPNSKAETEKSTDTVLPMATDNVQMELDPPTFSPHTISIYSCEYCPEVFTNKALLTIHTKQHKKHFVSHLHLKRLHNHEQVCFLGGIDSPELDPSDKATEVVDLQSDNMPNMDNPVTQLQSADLFTPFTKEPLQLDQSEPRQALERAVKPGGGQRIYKCSVCKRIYVTLSSLKRHENVHSWQRAYPCHYCNKVFALAEYRTKHEIWHTGERRYQCSLCLETFMTYYILKNHQKSFHGIDPRLAVRKRSTNGGFKASGYPIKLYRLLPKKFRKRQYKTYSQTYSESVEGVDQPPVDNSLIPAFEGNGIISNPDTSLPMPVTFMATPNMVALEMPRISFDQPCDQYMDQSLKGELESCHQRGTRKEAEHRGSPFISYENPNPLQSNPGSPANDMYYNHIVPLLNSLNNRQSELSTAAKTVEAMTKEIRLSGAESLAHDEMLGVKTETYIAKPACSGPSADGGAMPLCQITVKIGSEAIVQRRIEGSKLFPMKKKKIGELIQVESPSQCPPTRGNSETPRLRLRTAGVTAAIESEMYDEPNDRDTGNMLWRPYYSYKAKKKRKKLRFKHRKYQQFNYSATSIDRDTACEADLERCQVTDESISAGSGEVKHHFRNSSPRATYNCDICDSSFITESGLRTHVIGSHPCFCRSCGKQGPPGEAPAGGEYLCNSCMENGSCFDDTPQSPSTKKRYHCSFCPQHFLYLATKKSHEKKHQETTGKGYKYDNYPPITTHLDKDDKQHAIKTEESENQGSTKTQREEYIFHRQNYA